MKFVVVHKGCTITLETDDKTFSLPNCLNALEQNIVHEVLKASGNVKARAAEVLQINRTTLVEKCHRWGFPMGEWLGKRNK